MVLSFDGQCWPQPFPFFAFVWLRQVVHEYWMHHRCFVENGAVDCWGAVTIAEGARGSCPYKCEVWPMHAIQRVETKAAGHSNCGQEGWDLRTGMEHCSGTYWVLPAYMELLVTYLENLLKKPCCCWLVFATSGGKQWMVLRPNSDICMNLSEHWSGTCLLKGCRARRSSSMLISWGSMAYVDYSEQVFQYRFEHTKLEFMQQIYHQIWKQLEIQRQ